MVAFHKVTVQLFAHRKTLSRHIASVHSFLSARSSSLYDAGATRGASTWLPSPSAEGPPSRRRPPLSWLLEAKTKLKSKQEKKLKGFHFKWKIDWKHPLLTKWITRLAVKNISFRRYITQIGSSCMVAKQWPNCHKAQEVGEMQIQSVRFLPVLECSEVEGTLGRLTFSDPPISSRLLSISSCCSSSSSASSSSWWQTDTHTNCFSNPKIQWCWFLRRE